MNSDDPRYELIRRHHDGEASLDEIAQLEADLSEDAAFREAYVRYLNLDVALGSIAYDRLTRNEDSRPPLSTALSTSSSGRSYRRPLSAAAAGFAIGICCTSIVWAYAIPRYQSAGSGGLTIVTQSFEDAAMPWLSGFPKQTGQWSGDAAHVVTAEGSVFPKSGTHMLRFEPATSELFSRAHYILDLAKNPLPPGVRQVRLAASFRPTRSERKSRYLLRVASFAQKINEIDPRWMIESWSELDDQALARAARGFPVLADTDEWQTVSLTVDVPDGSQILVVSLWAATMEGKAENRLPHYLDDVSLTCVEPEMLP